MGLDTSPLHASDVNAPGKPRPSQHRVLCLFELGSSLGEKDLNNCKPSGTFYQ